MSEQERNTNETLQNITSTLDKEIELLESNHKKMMNQLNKNEKDMSEMIQQLQTSNEQLDELPSENFCEESIKKNRRQWFICSSLISIIVGVIIALFLLQL